MGARSERDMKALYLDAAATTPVFPSVVQAMKPLLTERYGNPSSPHALGEEALKTLTHARTLLAKEINARPHELIFTSSSTESNNLALFGLAHNAKKKKIIMSAMEHASIRAPCDYLRSFGYTITTIPVNSEGFVDLARLEKEIDEHTLVVSVMHANNIIGTLQDIASIGALCRKKGVVFHTDAAQSFGKLKIDVRTMQIDLLSASAHKIGGPKGIGLLYVREGLSLGPVQFGGGQERGVRSGTENVAGAVGFSKALEEVKKKDWTKIARSRDILMHELEKRGGRINGSRIYRLANNVHVSFPGMDADMLVTRLSHKGIYVSTGSACESRGEKDDHVLRALGLGKKEIEGSIRISLWTAPLPKDIERIIREIGSGLEK